MENSMKVELFPKIRFIEFNQQWSKRRLISALEVCTTKNKDEKYSKWDMLSVSSSAGVVNQIEYKGRSFAGVSVIPYHILERGQIVYTKSPLKEYPFGIIKFNNFKTGIVSTLYAVYSIKDGFNGQFLDYYFQLPLRLNKYLKPIVNIGAKNDMKVNNREVLSNFIVFPSLPEQQKIASFLSAVDKKIQQLTRKKELLEQYKKWVMQKIFSQEIRFKDENGDDFPEWELRKLSEILFEHGLKSTGDEQVFSVSVHKGVVNQIEHLGRSFAAATTAHYNLVKPHDIVYTKSPTGDFPFGIIKQALIDKNVLVSPLYGVFTPETQWLGYMLNVYFESVTNTHNYLHSIIQKGAKNTINITNKTFLSKKLKLPISNDEQKKIGLFLKKIDGKISFIKSQITETQQFKKGLLQQMFV